MARLFPRLHIFTKKGAFSHMLIDPELITDGFHGSELWEAATSSAHFPTIDGAIIPKNNPCTSRTFEALLKRLPDVTHK